MLALERHISKPFATQAADSDFEKYGSAASLVKRLSALSDEHIAALERALDSLGGHAASPVKEAISQAEGFVASAIDLMRKTKVSKALRDDYTALALCASGYTLLQTTALALSNAEVASLAQRHLHDYAQCVVQVGEALPAVVIAELQDIGLSVNAAVIEQARNAVEQAWRTT